MSSLSLSPSHLQDDESETTIPETRNFAQFVTIDKFSEAHSLILPTSSSFSTAFIHRISKSRLMGIWERSKAFVALTLIAILIGSIAGFIQIFTETLVNWKTGHCARNWLLNKSFCCNGIGIEDEIGMTTPSPEPSALFKRQEIQCIDQAIWIPWSGYLFPFLIFLTLSVLFAAASTALVKYIAPMATASGISEIKVWVSGFEYKAEFLSPLTLVVKSVALPLAISSGLSVGKEGPSVHYATCCAFLVSNLLARNSLTYSAQFDYLVAATGAGVAVAFGAPIGGVLFALEEMTSASEFNPSTLWKSYYLALIAVTTLRGINPFRNGKIILFNVLYDKNWEIIEIPVFILLGIFGGLFGKYISHWNRNYVYFRQKYLKKWQVEEVVVLAVVTALLSYFNEFLKMDMTESMGILFHECYTEDNTLIFDHRICKIDRNTHLASFLGILLSLIFATVIRAFLIIVSYGATIPAGIFVPSMAVGATFGRALSLIVERYVGTKVITPGAYAFLGAAATLSGITNLTLTVVVIMLELTGAFIYIIPTMIVVAVARIVLTSLESHGGIADQMILANGYPILENDDEIQGKSFVSNHTASSVMSRDLQTFNEVAFLSELESILYGPQNSKFVNGFPIVRTDPTSPNSRPKCVGYVLRRHLVKKLASAFSGRGASKIKVYFIDDPPEGEVGTAICLKDIVNIQPIKVSSDVTVLNMMRMFRHLGCKTIIVEDDGLLSGLVTVKDVIRFEREQTREIYGPSYQYNESLNQKWWSLLQRAIRVGRQYAGFQPIPLHDPDV